jgi:2-keto-4-pentenoate hydratase
MTDPVAARLLAQNRLARQCLRALPLELRPQDEAAAYAIQTQLHAELASKLGKISGHKIGCTTAVMQRFLNIPNPCAGGVFANTVHQSGITIPHHDFVRPGVECEIVVLLKNDLPPVGQSYTQATVVDAVGAIAAGIEIVDDRYVDYKTLDTPTLIADDFFDAGCVIGPLVRDWRTIDIPALIGRTLINGVEAGRGMAGAVMGHPFAALAWLANSLIARGQYLKRDEFVFTGSVVETRWINAGDNVNVAIDGLGTATVTFLAR